MNQQRIIITGGSGFLGTNLVEDCLVRGADVLNLDIRAPRNPAHKRYWQQMDLLDRTGIIQTVSDFQPEVILHFGARTDLDENQNLAGYAANIEGVCNVIDAIRATSSIKRVIFASSQLVCRLGYTPTDDFDYQLPNLYGHSKALGERIIRAANDFNATWTIVRPTSIWGPWFDVPYKNFFLTITRNLYVQSANVKTLKLWGFVGNTVYQIAKLVCAPIEQVHKRMFYLADYEPLELSEFANRVQTSVGARKIPAVPASWLQLAARIGDLAQKLGWRDIPLTSFRYNNIVTSELQNIEPLREIVGPLPFTCTQGIEATTHWLREAGELSKVESGFHPTASM